MKPPENAVWVSCTNCRYTWPAVHLPMEMHKASAVMLATHCPRCGATPDKLNIASDDEVTYAKAQT